MMSSFDLLPAEVNRLILRFMDISSLAALTSSQRAIDSRISALASDDTTWYTLIQRRFGIGCPRLRRRHPARKKNVVSVRRQSSSSLSDKSANSDVNRKRRPITYGGSTWKEAYRSLSCTMRIPETSLNGSAVFASSFSRQRSIGNGSWISKRRGSRLKTEAMDFLGVWCGLNHAENCRTKSVQVARAFDSDRVRADNGTSNYDSDRRFLEFRLCLQNTKTGFGSIIVPDLNSIRFVSLNDSVSHGLTDGNHDCNAFPIIDTGRWAPKVVLRQRFSEDIEGERNYHHCLDETPWGGIVLRPFEIVILSIHVSCSSDLIYETDVLSTLSCVHIPVASFDGWQYHEVSEKVTVATAHFIPEELIWDYYCQLPGGCLSLVDRSRIIST